MNGIEDEDRSDWFIRKKRAGNTRVGGGSGVAAVGALATSNQAPAKPTCSRQASIKSYTLPKLFSKEKNEFQKWVAMHYFGIGTFFQRVDDVHLKDARKMQARCKQDAMP